MRFPACRRSEELKNGYIPVSPNEKVRMFVDECCELVPDAQADSFRAQLGSVFGAEHCAPLMVRPVGGWALSPMRFFHS